MADYPEMYKVLFRAITKAIEGLQEAQIAAEELYISADDTVITLSSRTTNPMTPPVIDGTRSPK